MKYKLFVTKNEKYWGTIRKKYDGEISHEFIDLINGMLSSEENARFTLKEVTSHDWFT